MGQRLHQIGYNKPIQAAMKTEATQASWRKFLNSMWKLSVRSPSNKPCEYVLKKGLYTLGRHTENEIVIEDESASRRHAELECQNNTLTIRDLDSTNGTFVNRERISEPHTLKHGDQISIGFHVINISSQDPAATTAANEQDRMAETQPMTRDLLLESVDKYSILLNEFTSRLTASHDLDQALEEIASFLQKTIAADKCRVILAMEFDQIREFGFSESIAKQAITKKGYPLKAGQQR